jgi:uncharacterized protein YecT (DUF1311 family)
MEEGEQHPIVIWTENCLNQEEGNADMHSCFSEAHEKWDAELDEIYEELLGQLKEKEREHFKKAQAAWLQYRDAEFALIDTVYGESDSTPPLMPLLSKITIVKSRVAQFESYLEVLSGELQELVEEVVVKPCISHKAKDIQQLLPDINQAYEQGYQLISMVYLPEAEEEGVSKTVGHLAAVLCKPVSAQ